MALGVFQVHLVVFQIDRGSESIQDGSTEAPSFQRPRVLQSELSSLPNPIPVPMPLRVSAAVKSPELHGAHVGKATTWLSSTAYHMALKSTPTRVWYRTTWAVAHSENFCVRLVAFVCLILFPCKAFPPFLSHQFLQM